MNTKHTPGPWTVNGRTIAHIETTQPSGAAWESNVATVSDSQNKGQVAANARLIAAAPDLLAALRAVIHELDAFGFINSQENDPDGHESPAIAAVYAAIAKATGQQQPPTPKQHKAP